VEVELNDYSPLGQAVEVDPPVHIPHQQVRINVFRTDVVVYPPLAPLTQAPNDIGKLLPGRREMVFSMFPVGVYIVFDYTARSSVRKRWLSSERGSRSALVRSRRSDDCRTTTPGRSTVSSVRQ